MIDWVVNAFKNLRIFNLDSFSGHSLIPSDRANFLSFSSQNIHRLFPTCWLWVAVISNLSWLRKICHIYCFEATHWLEGKQDVYPRSSRGEKVPNLRPVNVSAFCRTEPQRTLPSEGSSIKFHKICNLRIYFFFINVSMHFLHLLKEYKWKIYISVDTPSNSCSQ